MFQSPGHPETAYLRRWVTRRQSPGHAVPQGSQYAVNTQSTRSQNTKTNDSSSKDPWSKAWKLSLRLLDQLLKGRTW